MGQPLFQKGAETVISKWVKVYLKVGQLFQCRAKWLFQSAAVMSKWGNYFKMGHNTFSPTSFAYIKYGCYYQLLLIIITVVNNKMLHVSQPFIANLFKNVNFPFLISYMWKVQLLLYSNQKTYFWAYNSEV